MVQLHAANAGVPLNRPTLDVDIVLHIETGAAVFNEVKKQLEDLGYELRWSLKDEDPIHRFVRGAEKTPEIVDVMVADHLAPKHVPKLRGHPVFQVPGATSALRKTVNCTIEIDGASTRLSLPTVLGALILKGAAFISDRNDTQRHLDDAAILASSIGNPITERNVPMTEHDPVRLETLAKELEDPQHRSWQLIPNDRRERARRALMTIATRPKTSRHGGS
ncbi:hypothetical protein [Rhodococcus qingshengii]|uniref:hypothetical protein n=1 Tax=Rhodococcus qingshengii TaxID=334542 RepID=UPI002035FC98|nr:hypothetical protein [Rhodococcus qingshengii]